MTIRNISKSIAWATALLASTAALLAASFLIGVGTADAASTAFVNGAGDLIVNGDGGVQQVNIHLEPGHQSVRIEAGDNSAANLDFYGEIRDIKVNLRGGHDKLKVTKSLGYEYPRNVTINMGSGRNTVSMRGITIDGNLKVIDGAETSSVVFQELAVYGTSNISLGGGTNEYASFNGYWGGSHSVSVSGAGTLDHESASESFRRATVTGGNKADTVQFRSQVGVEVKLTINTKGGADQVQILDRVNLNGSTSIRTGSGDDVATVMSSDVNAPFSFRGDSGADQLNISGGDYNSSVTLNGGGGSDQLTGEANDFAVAPTITSFEIN